MNGTQYDQFTHGAAPVCARLVWECEDISTAGHDVRNRRGITNMAVIVAVAAGIGQCPGGVVVKYATRIDVSGSAVCGHDVRYSIRIAAVVRTGEGQCRLRGAGNG